MQNSPGIPRNVHQVSADEFDRVGNQRLSVGRNHVLAVRIIHALIKRIACIVAGVVFHHRINLIAITITFNDSIIGRLEKVGKPKGYQGGHQDQDQDDAPGLTGKKRYFGWLFDSTHYSLAYDGSKGKILGVIAVINGYKTTLKLFKKKTIAVEDNINRGQQLEQ